jgi:hypothetical protein
MIDETGSRWARSVQLNSAHATATTPPRAMSGRPVSDAGTQRRSGAASWSELEPEMIARDPTALRAQDGVLNRSSGIESAEIVTVLSGGGFVPSDHAATVLFDHAVELHARGREKQAVAVFDELIIRLADSHQARLGVTPAGAQDTRPALLGSPSHVVYRAVPTPRADAPRRLFTASIDPAVHTSVGSIP